MEDLGGGRPGTLVIPQRNYYIARTAAELKYECAIIGCSRSYNENCNNILYFPFPTDNEQWKLAFAEYAVEFRYQKNPRICSLHFLPEDISEDGLCENAVPKLCLKRPAASFLSKVVLEWILRRQYYQNISRKDIFNIVEEVRRHIDANFVRMPKWITNFKYQPIKRDPSSGILRKPTPFTDSGVSNIIRGLRFAQRQEEITPQLYTVRRRRAVKKKTEKKEEEEDIIQLQNETVKDGLEDSWDAFPEISFDGIDGTSEKEYITHDEDDFNDPLETLEEVWACLRLVEGYALYTEGLKAIGIITEIKTLLSSDKDC